MGEVNEKIRVRLIRSPIGTDRRVRATLRGLGLTKVGRQREVPRTEAVQGMIQRVRHLLEVQEEEG